MARPDPELLLAYRGTSALLRRLNILLEEGALDPARRSDSAEESRRAIAGVGYSARAYAAFAEGVRDGSDVPLSDLLAERDERTESGISLPSRALGHLAFHSAVHLRVEWRDLPESRWEHEVRDSRRAAVCPRDTVSARAREVWMAALLLGLRTADLPRDGRAIISTHPDSLPAGLLA